MKWHLHNGDCVAFMSTLPAESIDSVVCDPPYGLGFMGKDFDKLGPGPAQQAWHADWLAEALRVLKPGGHLVAFGGQRTIHRLTCAAEDAGFEVRDQGAWAFWSGFPKSLDVSKAIDKAAGAEREVVGPGRWNHIKGDNAKQRDCLIRPGGKHDITAPATENARRWQGWGTALKPALEPWVLCRKPLIGTVADNVLRYGTGALNIDACRYRYGDLAWPGPSDKSHDGAVFVRGANAGPPRMAFGSFASDYDATKVMSAHDLGRWPANIYYCPKVSRAEREAGCEHLTPRTGAEAVDREEGSAGMANPGAGAGRTADSVRNHHPTLKPIELMAWLCRLVTPSGGVVLDPFAGSGSCGAAALAGGFRYLGAELDPDYATIAEARIAHHAGLFGLRQPGADGVL